MKILFIVLCVVVVFVVLYILFPFIQVMGDSMFPTYRDGEFIFGTKIYRKSNLKEGEVILYKTPTDGKIVIKRISSINIKSKKIRYFYCVGDNLDCSYDSRNYGFISSKNVVCKVINQRRKH